MCWGSGFIQAAVGEGARGRPRYGAGGKQTGMWPLPFYRGADKGLWGCIPTAGPRSASEWLQGWGEQGLLCGAKWGFMPGDGWWWLLLGRA